MGMTSSIELGVSPLAYRCRCRHRVFYRNSQCLACGAPLGYAPSRAGVFSLQRGEQPGAWHIVGDETVAPYRRCDNFSTAAACNWLIEPDDVSHSSLCKACRLNRTIPDLSRVENGLLWLGMERAKRRLVSQLVRLDLPIASKVSEDPEHGIAYDFLRALPGRPRVMTALIEDSNWQAECRQLFGDERLDYAAAIGASCGRGPPAHWRQRFISAYASAHPAEDWAETWAHYLHLRDTLDTAISFGIDAHSFDVDSEPFGVADLWQPKASDGRAFVDMLHRWIWITGVMNEMSRAMGLHDFYPFVLPRAAVAKLHFIHCVVSQWRNGPLVESRS